MGLEAREERGGVGRRRGARLEAREELERLLEETEAAAEGEVVHPLAGDEEIDDRLAAREVRDDSGSEGDCGFGAGLVVGVDVHHDGDAPEVLLLVLAHDRLAGARPATGVQVADRVARAVGPHTEQLHRLPRLRGQRHAARLLAARLGERDAEDARDPREDEEARAAGRAGAALSEAERDQRDGVERVEVVLAAGDEARPELDARALSSLQVRDARRSAAPPPVPREKRPGDPDRVQVARAVVRDRDAEDELFAEEHPARRRDGRANVAPKRVERANQDRRTEDRREDRPQDVELRVVRIDPERPDDHHEERHHPPLVGQRPVDRSDRAEEDPADPPGADSIAPLFGRRNEDVVEAREVRLPHVGTSTCFTIPATIDSRVAPP